jgi:CubicO group peptidase (beta-lactamase class C family)
MTRFDDFSAYLESAAQSWNCPGAAVAVVRGDDILYQQVYGLRDVDQGLPVTPETRFAMASCTKSFAAMSIALLVDDGLIEWDKPVRNYAPEFILHDEYATAHITVRDMLCHRSGMPRHDLSAWRLDLPLADFVHNLRHFRFSATFREKFQYNNLMYYSIAYLVERITGQPWEDFIRTRIFEPLGMTASNFDPAPPLDGQHTAWGYRIDRDEFGAMKQLVRTEHGKHTALSPGAAGALFSTLADLTQWLKVQVNEGRAGDVQLVSLENLKQMHLPQMVVPGGGINEALMENPIVTYGLGWFIEPYRGYTLVHHGGNVEGCSLIIACVPQEKIGIVGLTNIGGLPLRDVILYESVDRALDLPSRDWNARYHQMWDPIIVGMAQSKQTAAAERVSDAPPTHPLDRYTGTFVAEGYPEFGVRQTADGLQASTLGSLDWSLLRHYHYNTFEWHLVDFDLWMKVSFIIDDNGDISAVSVPIEPEVDNVRFERKPVTLDAETVSAIVGRYEPPIDGMMLTVSERGGKLYITQSGEAPQEVKVYRLDADTVGLIHERTRFDLVRENGRIARLVIKMPGMTLEAPRRD